MTDSTLTLQSTMDEAIENLQHSICLAEICQKNQSKVAEELVSHTTALEEDMQSLSLTNTKIPATLDLAKQTLKKALWLKRTLEREAIQLNAQKTVSQPQAESSASSAKPSAEKRRIKLENLTIPTFSGDATKFKIFFDTFLDNVEQNPDLTDTAKWLHLDKSLSGTAAELVSKIPRRPETRKIALDILKSRYGSIDHTICDLYQQLSSLPPATMADDTLRMTQTQIEGLLLSLEGLGHTVNENSYIKSVVKGKFPRDILHLIIPTPESDTLEQIRINLQSVLLARERAVSDIVYMAPNVSSKPHTSSQGGQRTPKASASTFNRPLKCIFCGLEHWSDECPTYTTITARKQKLGNRCEKCFRAPHSGECLTKRRCAYCDSTDHNRALCPKKFPLTTTLYAGTPILKQPNDGVYLTLLLTVTSDQSTQPVQVRAVLDSAGGRTILTSDIAKQLNISPIDQPVSMTGLGRTNLPAILETRNTLYLHPPESSPIPLATHITPTIADDLPAADIVSFRQTYPNHAQTLIPPSGAGQKIDLLLGKDSLASICTLQHSIQVSTEHQLLSTKFGFLILRNQLTPPQNATQPCLLTFNKPASDDLNKLWQLDSLGLGNLELDSDEQEEIALKSFYENIRFVNNRYEVAWPFTIYPPLLNDDYHLALGRLRSLWNKMKNNSDFLKAYNTIILDQEEKGVIEAITEQTEQNPHITHYLPHHPILRTDKATKIRIVYDASAKSSKNARSLNDNLHPGGNWVCDMVTILLNFRKNKQVVIADIEKAFLQIQIRESDRDAVRFLWLQDPLRPPNPDNLRVFRFCRMAFGIVSSPFLLAATIRHHLKQNPHPYNSLIEENLYADNLVVSLPNHIEPIEFYETVKGLFRKMSMNMTKWCTNIKELQAHIPSTDCEIANPQTVLGIQWHLEDDYLTLKPPNYSKLDDGILTKRKALQQMAAFYDPLGFAAPVTLQAKIFIRQLWAEERKWDDQLLATKQAEWAVILNNLKQTNKIRMNRQFFPNIPPQSITQLQIHTFTDASAEAYAVVIYARAVTNNTAYCTFIAAKSRLTPKKLKSIPRLELLAILIGARYTKFITKSLKWHEPPTHYLWTDSRCAIAWIEGTKLLPPVIQRQVHEINKLNFHHIRHVASELNFADVASRGATVAELQNMNWWNGPPWLADTNQWPAPTPTNTEILHEETEILFTFTERKTTPLPETLTGVFHIDYDRYSSLRRLLIVIAYCMLAINRILKKPIFTMQTALDTNLAEHLAIKHEQHQAYQHIYAATKPATSIKNIRIFIDENGIVRCATRLENSRLPYPATSPILLVKGSHLTKLIVMHAHEQTNHSGTAHTLAELRKRYWLPQGRREVYNIVRKECYTCKRYYAKPYCPPPPIALPEFRITQATRPFQSIGLDVLGPFFVRTTNVPNAVRTKRWILLCTCAVTRAMHLELLVNMTTAAFLDAFRRFVARRGVPVLAICDNAPQLHELDDNLRKYWSTITEENQTINYFAEKRIQFRFLPPHSPWMGGFYERLVYSIKQSLEKTYGNKCLLERQFETSIIEVEGILNARPLTYVDAQPTSRIITPQDFLNIQHTAIPLADLPDIDRNKLLHLWKSSQNNLRTFWQEWSDHFILYLRERDDKLSQRKGDTLTPPQIGDIVLIINPETRRCAWQLARVETLIKSNDGHVRSVLLNLGHNTRIIRPIIKLAPLGLHIDIPPENVPELTAARDAIIIDDTPYEPPAEPVDEEDEIIEIQLQDDW